MKPTNHFLNDANTSGKLPIRTFICLVFLSLAVVANAQKKWNVELRSGVNFPTKELGDANLKTGVGFEGNLSYRFMPSLAAYGGWSWNRFSADRSFAGNDMDFEETGYNLGLQYFHSIGNSAVNYMVRGGAIYNHIETENNGGKIIDDSGHGLGWQLGAGAMVPLGTRLSFVPEIRYRSLSRDITIDNFSTAADLNYISGSLGLSWSF